MCVCVCVCRCECERVKKNKRDMNVHLYECRSDDHGFYGTALLKTLTPVRIKICAFHITRRTCGLLLNCVM